MSIMAKDKKALLLITSFIFLIFIRNIAFWSKEQTFIFGDTSIYALYLAALSENLTTILSAKQSLLLWNPNYLSVGIPTLSALDMGFLYPPNLGLVVITRLLGNSLLIFPFFTLLTFLHLGFGGFFIYKILNIHWKLDRFSSLIGGLLWLFTGYNLEFIAASSILFASSYLPACFYANIKYKETNEMKYFFLFFLLLAGSFLVGYPIPSLIILLVCITYNLLNNVGYDLKKVFLKIMKEQLKGLFLITVPIISPLYLTSFYNFSRTIRGNIIDLHGFLSNSVQISNLTESIIPLNTPFNRTSTTNLVYLYVSIVAILILLQAKERAAVFKDRRNISIVVFGIIGGILALGGITSIPTLIYLTTPIISFFRRLSVFSLIPSFAFCLLVPQYIKSALDQKVLSRPLVAGLKIMVGLLLAIQVAKVLYKGDVNPLDYNSLLQSLGFIAIVCTITTTAIVSFRYDSKIARGLLILALLIEAGTVIASKAYINSKTNPARVFAPNDLTRYIQKIIKPGERVDMLETQHNYSTDYLKIEQTAGYLALASEYGVRVNEALTYKGKDYNPKNLRDILGVKYIVKKGDTDNPDLKKVVEIPQKPQNPNFYSFNYTSLSWEVDPENTHYSIYENPTALPRLYLASGIITITEQNKYLIGYFEKLESPKTVIINESDIEKHEISEEGVVEIQEYKRNYIKASVKSSDPTFLANSTGFYPGWSVRINGKEKEPIQTNWFMMGVYVPKGDSVVEFYYTPHGINWGLLYISFASMYWLIKRRSLQKIW